MHRLHRTLAAAILACACAGGAALLLPPAAFVAAAQDAVPPEAQPPEARLAAFIEAQAIPAGAFKWAGVRQDGDALLVEGLAVDLAAFDGTGTVPIGDLRLWDIAIEDGTVTSFRAAFTGIVLDLAALSEAGQALAASGTAEASAGMALVVIADALKGLGYTNIEASLSYETRTDLASGVTDEAISLRMPGLFDAGFSGQMTGVTTAYLDWDKANTIKVYLDGSPEAGAEIDRRIASEEGPYSGVGITRVAIDFDDQGLMQRLEPQLAVIRPMMLGTGPDGTPRSELSDLELREMATLMGRGVLPAEKLLPVITAFYRFILKPDVLKLAVRVQPAITLREIVRMQQPDGSAPPDIADRLTFEASNLP